MLKKNQIKKCPVFFFVHSSFNVASRIQLFGEAGKFKHFDRDPFIDFSRRPLGGILTVFDVPD